MTDILSGVDAHTQPCFSFRNRVLRFLWKLVHGILFRFTPVYCHFWRAFLLRLFGARIGKGCHIYPRARIWAPWNLEMGDLSCLANHSDCSSMDKVIIGDRVVISEGAKLVTGTHDYTDKKFPLITKPIRIGSDAWVASEAFICPGVTVGEGAVIGARSVVTKDVPAWMVCAGNPCHPIKPREFRGPEAK